MSSPKHIAYALATAFTAGPFTVDAMVERASLILGKRWRWVRPLAQRVFARFSMQARPRATGVRAIILSDVGFRRACSRHEIDVDGNWCIQPSMSPLTNASFSERLPRIETNGQLADWLRVRPRQLGWLADRRGLERHSACQQSGRYAYRVLSKGSRRFRLIEIPMPWLKLIQRQVLFEILDCVPAHRTAHGFCRGRSIHSFVQPHIAQPTLLRMDLREFFPSVRISRVAALFRTLGYPEEVSDTLAGVCTNSVPSHVWSSREFAGQRGDTFTSSCYERPHLPQGAPTSPAIANLCAYRLDCRLDGLAKSADVQYTRYADDLAFSGCEKFRRCVTSFRAHVAATVMEEGFFVNFRKTRVMTRSVRQEIAGVVVNQCPNPKRRDFERLKAILYNCVRFSPVSQNREHVKDFRAHLNGKIAFVESLNVHKGKQLRGLFEKIVW